MYIYLNNNEELREKLVIANPEEDSAGYLDVNKNCVRVYCALTYPYVKTVDTEIESVMQNDCISNFFLKAADISFPNFNAPRECGIYKYGNAKADLRITKDGKFKLKILPTLSYEKKQVRRFKIFMAKLFAKKEYHYVEAE